MALGIGGLTADSSALLANALDDGSDAAVYLISFLAVGRAAVWKRGAARVSGVMLLIFAAGVLIDAGRRWYVGSEPVGWTMMGLAVVAAIVNLTCLRLIRRQHGEDVNMKAAETYSFNDFADRGRPGPVAGPGPAVGVIVAAIALKGGIDILRDAHRAKQTDEDRPCPLP